MASVSFIIPHKGRDDMLLTTLHSISELDTHEHTIEVVLVTQNSAASDSTLAFESKLNLQIIHNSPDATISASRNLGVKQATGEYLAFLDADIQLAKNWLIVMLEVLAKPKTLLASSMQVNSPSAPVLEKIRTSLSNAILDDTVTFLPGRNLFLTRSTFEAVGGFPEHLITCEDYYFTERVASMGALFYTSETSYVHLGEDKAFSPMFKKEIWRGQSNLASISGRRVPLGEWPSFFVPIMLPLGLILALVSSMIGTITLVCLSLFVTLLPILAYSFRLKRLVKKQVSFWQCLRFYSVYFPARVIGTITGIFSAVSTSSHK